MNIHLSARELQQHIELLLHDFPELAEDEELRLDMIEGETELDKFLAQVVEKSIEARTMADAIKSRIDSLNERRSRFLRQEAAFRELGLKIMQRADINKVQLTERHYFLSGPAHQRPSSQPKRTSRRITGGTSQNRTSPRSCPL